MYTKEDISLSLAQESEIAEMQSDYYSFLPDQANLPINLNLNGSKKQQ